jgi:CBS domain containing-hemolysin-like protein
MTTLQVVLGELVPKSAALQYPTQIALTLVLPMRASLKLYAWFLAILNGSGLAILKLFGVAPSTHHRIHSPEEIEFVIGESRRGGLIEVQEHERLRRAMRLASRPVSHLMVPKRFIVGLSLDAPPAAVIEVLAENNFTRIPVYDGSPDKIVGILHTKDLVAEVARSGAVPPIRAMVRPIPSVTERATAGELLDVLRQHRSHLAVVASGYGPVGLVTFGDLLTELLGRITGKARFGQPAPARLPDGRVRLPGLMRLDEAADWIQIRRTGRASTIGGLVLQAAGRIPRAGERIRIDGFEFEIERVGHQSVTSVLVSRVPEPEGAGR